MSAHRAQPLSLVSAPLTALHTVTAGGRVFDRPALMALRADHPGHWSSVDVLALWLATECDDAALVECCEVPPDWSHLSPAALLASLVPAPTARLRATLTA